MGKKTKRRDALDGYANFPNHVLASAAVRTLPPSAFMVMVYLAMRCYGTKGNGHIVYANRSGCRWFDPEKKKWVEMGIGGPKPLSKSTIGDGLRELERRGLIVCTQRSTFHQKRLAKTYRLTWRRTEDNEATNDFMSWRPNESGLQISEARPVHRPMGQATGQHAGSSYQPKDPKQAVQADTLAYRQPHRPAHRPRIYHVVGDGEDVGTVLEDIAKQVRAAAGLAS